MFFFHESNYSIYYFRILLSKLSLQHILHNIGQLFDDLYFLRHIHFRILSIRYSFTKESINFDRKVITVCLFKIIILLTAVPISAFTQENYSDYSNDSSIIEQNKYETQLKVPTLKTINEDPSFVKTKSTTQLIAALLATIVESTDTQNHISSNILEKNISSFISQGASKKLSNTLNRYGKAEVNIFFDKAYSVGGRIDWLLPFNENHKHLLFSQIGLGREQQSTLFNFGIGQRHFRGRWLLGYHAFLDSDINNGYLRAALGAEAWQDYFKLGTNFYLPISGWKRWEQTYWDVRPARGYDINLLSYLPLYPALGSRVRYEHYFCGDVGIFAYPKLNSHPNIITLGLHYTPIPLFTLSIDKRMRTWSQNEIRVSLKFNLQLDKPIQQQLRLKQSTRSLIGSRYDIIERNNKIILEYKDPIFANLPGSIVGTSHSRIPFTLNITSKYAISSITWSGSAVNACGLAANCITAGTDGQYILTLPAYHQHSSNQYQLQAQVTNKIGDSTSTNIMLVTVNLNSIIDPKATLLFAAEAISDKILILNTSVQPFMSTVVSGGNAPYTFSISPTLPPGLNIDATTGIISGNPTSLTPPTIYQITITDANGQTIDSPLTLIITPTPLVATVRVSQADFSIDPDNDYNQTVWPFSVSGGVCPYAFTSNPPLPTGLSFDSQGNISGGPQISTPKITYTITAKDKLGISISRNFTLTVHE